MTAVMERCSMVLSFGKQRVDVKVTVGDGVVDKSDESSITHMIRVVLTDSEV